MEEKKENALAYTFNDVLIVPKYSEIDSRRNVDTSSDFGLFKVDLSIFSSNMKDITESKLAISMIENGAGAFLHRFCNIDRAVSEYLTVKNYFENQEQNIQNTVSCNCGGANVCLENTLTQTINSSNLIPDFKRDFRKNYAVGVSIGVQEEDIDRFIKLYDAGARIFCIDIAHGHCKQLKKMLGDIKFNRKDIYVVAGNVATPEGAYDLASWGADCVKVGIGPGAACMTRKNTGIGVPQLYALESVRKEFDSQGIKNVKIICDGGLSNIGDIVKCLKYADAGMLGNMLSGTSETPGSVFEDENGRFYKCYRGSASGENKTQNGNVNEYVEGIAKTVTFKGHVKHILRKIKHGIQSGFSYVGANNLKEFQEKCEFIRISDGGRTESKI